MFRGVWTDPVEGRRGTASAINLLGDFRPARGSITSSFRGRIRATGRQIRPQDETAKIKEPAADRVVISGGLGTVYLRLVAFGDFNGDGIEDVLLETFYDFSLGSLSYGSSAILTRLKEGGPLVFAR